jgi:hypothetical protein
LGGEVFPVRFGQARRFFVEGILRPPFDLFLLSLFSVFRVFFLFPTVDLLFFLGTGFVLYGVLRVRVRRRGCLAGFAVAETVFQDACRTRGEVGEFCVSV